MNRKRIRLACSRCDRDDFDGVDELPADWTDITIVQSWDDSVSEVEFDDHSTSPTEWYTHLGTCPDCEP